MGRACAKCGDDLVMGLLDYLPCRCEVSATPAMDHEVGGTAWCAKCGDDLVVGLVDCECEVSATPALDRVLESARQAECAKRGRRIRRLQPMKEPQRWEWNG